MVYGRPPGPQVADVSFDAPVEPTVAARSTRSAPPGDDKLGGSALVRGRDEAAGRGRAFVVMAAVFAVALPGVVAYALLAQNGTFTYALDDAALHLGLARDLA